MGVDKEQGWNMLPVAYFPLDNTPQHTPKPLAKRLGPIVSQEFYDFLLVGRHSLYDCDISQRMVTLAR